MNRAVAAIAVAITLLAAVEAKPKITETGGVRSLATVANRSVLARGSVFEVVGEGLGPAEALSSEPPYGQELGGVTVQLTASPSGPASAAWLISAAPGRIVGIVPSTLQAGDYKVTVSVNGEVSNSVAVKVAERNFGLITNTGSSGGMVSARVLAEGMEPVQVTLAAAVPAGVTLELDATGLGPIEGADNEPPLGGSVADAKLVIGGQEAVATYVGRNPARPGYDLVTVTLPAEGLPTGCVAPFQIVIGETASQTVSIPILGPEETSCKHPLGYTAEELAALAAGGSVIRGGFTLVHLLGKSSAAGFTYESEVDQFTGGFVRFTAEDVAVMAANIQLAQAYDENRCVVHDALEGPLGGVYVDAGPQMDLQGPAWSLTIPRITDPQAGLNQYNVILNSLFNGAPAPFQQTPGLRVTPGHHTLTGVGGEVVGPFSVELDVSPKLTWSNMDATKEIDTSKDLLVTWTGGGPEDIVNINGLVKGPAPEDPSKIVSRIWVCVAKGSDGQMVIPSPVLKKLPRVSEADVLDPKKGWYSSMNVASYNPAGVGEFRAPLTDGGMSDLTAFIFSFTWSKVPVPIK